MKNIDEQVQGFLDFVNASPSAFHAVQSAKERLLAQGYRLERLSWRRAFALER